MSSGAAATKSESLFLDVIILIGVVLLAYLLVASELDCVVLFWNSFFSWKLLENGLLKFIPSLKLLVPLKDAFLVLSIMLIYANLVLSIILVVGFAQPPYIYFTGWNSGV